MSTRAQLKLTHPRDVAINAADRMRGIPDHEIGDSKRTDILEGVIRRDRERVKRAVLAATRGLPADCQAMCEIREVFE